MPIGIASATAGPMAVRRCGACASTRSTSRVDGSSSTSGLWRSRARRLETARFAFWHVGLPGQGLPRPHGRSPRSRHRGPPTALVGIACSGKDAKRLASCNCPKPGQLRCGRDECASHSRQPDMVMRGGSQQAESRLFLSGSSIARAALTIATMPARTVSGKFSDIGVSTPFKSWTDTSVSVPLLRSVKLERVWPQEQGG